MFPQRGVLIFMIFLCCFRSCLCTNCSLYPYHPSCRGTMKRTFNPVENSYSIPAHMNDDLRNLCPFLSCETRYFIIDNDKTVREIKFRPHAQDIFEMEGRKGLKFRQRFEDFLLGARDDTSRDYND